MRERPRRHPRPGERTLLAASLAVLVLCLAFLAVPSCRQTLLWHSQATADAWDERWTRRVERGEALLAAQRFEEAAAHLEAVDRRFPAPLVKYGRDGERERLLRALGASHAALGRKRRTLETYRRLVAYDPLNYLNHVALAEAALRFDEPDEALAHFEEVLRFHPGHLPSLRAVVERAWTRATGEPAWPRTSAISTPSDWSESSSRSGNGARRCRFSSTAAGTRSRPSCAAGSLRKRRWQRRRCCCALGRTRSRWRPWC